MSYTKNFESICVILPSNYNIQPKAMTTLAFYSAYELHTKEQDFKTTLTLDDIANGTSENEAEIDSLTDKLLTFTKPQVYSGKKRT